MIQAEGIEVLETFKGCPVLLAVGNGEELRLISGTLEDITPIIPPGKREGGLPSISKIGPLPLLSMNLNCLLLT